MPGSEVAMITSTSGCLEQFVRDGGVDVRVQLVKEKRLYRDESGGCGRKEAPCWNNPGNRMGKETGERNRDVGRQLYIGFFLSN